METERRSVTVIEFVVMFIFITAVFALVLLVLSDFDFDSVLSARITTDERELSSNFGALLVDDKGRTVPAVVQVWEEDIPKLAEGKAWRLLIDTDDPRWNLEE